MRVSEVLENLGDTSLQETVAHRSGSGPSPSPPQNAWSQTGMGGASSSTSVCVQCLLVPSFMNKSMFGECLL